MEQPPRWAVRPAAVLRIPGRLPVLPRRTGSAQHTGSRTNERMHGEKLERRSTVAALRRNLYHHTWTNPGAALE